MKTTCFVLMIAVIASCDSRHKEAADGSYEVAAVGDDSDVELFSEAEELPPARTVQRKLIRVGSIEFEAADAKKTRDDIEKIATSLNGYVSNETNANYSDRISFSQEIRVPSESFDQLIQQTEKLARKVESRSIDVKDVTEEFIDVEARIKTKRELENRYRDILARASKVQDLLEIEREMESVRTQIESAQGRLNYLKNNVEYSTLRVTFYETVATDFTFGNKMIASFLQGWSSMLVFLVGLVSVWPFLLLLSGAVYGISRLYKKNAPQPGVSSN